MINKLIDIVELNQRYNCHYNRFDSEEDDESHCYIKECHFKNYHGIECRQYQFEVADYDCPLAKNRCYNCEHWLIVDDHDENLCEYLSEGVNNPVFTKKYFACIECKPRS